MASVRLIVAADSFHARRSSQGQFELVIANSGL